LTPRTSSCPTKGSHTKRRERDRGRREEEKKERRREDIFCDSRKQI